MAAKANIDLLPEFTPPLPTKEDLDYVDLVNLDLSKFDDPAGREELKNTLYKAATGYGFLTLSNHGISDDTYLRQMRISNAMMTLSPEKKAPYEVTPEEDARGLYVGYKPAGPLGHKGGFPKQLDHYNILVHDPKSRPHPEIMRPFLEETYEVMHHIRTKILMKLLRLTANILEVPEGVLLSTHNPGGSKTEYIRYMMCEPRSQEESDRYRDIFLSGHTDWGSWTFLFRSQCRFRWVRHQPHSLIVNFGEAMERLTGGLFKATIHRVVQPPVDQRHIRRIGVIYSSALPMRGHWFQ
ncbi:clavaminate synthase-like protein [Penicillium angulare]|uniref:Clavaminate synthase-like protein n=1 Tax=Penicillium angulare TaxID=116970 RepID=A0A9W9F748_9EURO|nr:clavaminate synthase-like protein [Penicillium angulare]